MFKYCSINTKGIEKALEKNKDHIDAILRTQMRNGGVIQTGLKEYEIEKGELFIPLNNAKSNTYIKHFTNELLKERETNESHLKAFEQKLKEYQKSKIQMEKRIDEIDEALITLGYKGDEVE